MPSLAKSTALLRLGAMLAFLCYLFAGASLALPTEPRCARCAKTGTAGALKPGASCPLSHHGHDCHDAQKKTVGQIVLCPDGCLHHDGLGGEVPSVAKFTSALCFSLGGWEPAGVVLADTLLAALDPFLPPLAHPPSTRC
jgi:hypothetical protein